MSDKPKYTPDELDDEFCRTYWSVSGEMPSDEEVAQARKETHGWTQDVDEDDEE